MVTERRLLSRKFVSRSNDFLFSIHLSRHNSVPTDSVGGYRGETIKSDENREAEHNGPNREFTDKKKNQLLILF